MSVIFISETRHGVDMLLDKACFFCWKIEVFFWSMKKPRWPPSQDKVMILDYMVKQKQNTFWETRNFIEPITLCCVDGQSKMATITKQIYHRTLRWCHHRTWTSWGNGKYLISDIRNFIEHSKVLYNFVSFLCWSEFWDGRHRQTNLRIYCVLTFYINLFNFPFFTFCGRIVLRSA